MLIQDRIKLIMKSQGASPSEFADAIDVKRSNLSHVLSGRNKPSLDFLAKIVTNCPSVNAAWLIAGNTSNGEFEGENSSERNNFIHKTEEVSALKRSNKRASSRELIRVIAYYSDGTFETLTPSEQ